MIMRFLALLEFSSFGMHTAEWLFGGEMATFISHEVWLINDIISCWKMWVQREWEMSSIQFGQNEIELYSGDAAAAELEMKINFLHVFIIWGQAIRLAPSFCFYRLDKPVILLILVRLFFNGIRKFEPIKIRILTC